MTPAPSLVVLAHGTGDAAGRRTWGRLLVRLRERLPGVEVRLAYAGVAKPTLADLLERQRSGSADTQCPCRHSDHGAPAGVVVVPCFLAAGFHVRVDVPGQLAAIGRDDVVLAEPLGPDPALLDVALTRLREAGGDPGADALVLAAAGSTDAVAQADLRTAAEHLGRRVGRAVPVGYIAGGEPRVAEVVAEVVADVAADRPGRVALVTWLLAPGAFHRWLADAGADVVADPLGDHPGVVDVVLARYRAAVASALPAEVG